MQTHPILKNKYYLYLTEFFAGMAVMAVELGASRLLAPYFSSSQIVWTIIIGFIAGVVAKFVMPGSNEPAGFILTTILGIIGAFVATYLGQSLGWYAPGEGAGLIGAIVGAVIVLVVWAAISGRNRAA